MDRPRISGYQSVRYPGRNQADIIGVINNLPILTKLGGGCLIVGKFVGLLAIPAVFIPSLHSLGIILIITWGSLVFTSIVFCSYEHFREKKVGRNEGQKMALIQELLAENPDLRRELATTLEREINLRNHQEEIYGEDEDYELRKVVHLQLGRHH